MLINSIMHIKDLKNNFNQCHHIFFQFWLVLAGMYRYVLRRYATSPSLAISRVTWFYLSILTFNIYYVNKYNDIKSLKSNLKTILNLLFSCCILNPIIIMTEFLYNKPTFAPFLRHIKIYVWYLFTRYLNHL